MFQVLLLHLYTSLLHRTSRACHQDIDVPTAKKAGYDNPVYQDLENVYESLH